MSGVCRVGDSNDGGGTVVDGAGSVFVNGQPVALVGSMLTKHGKGKHAGPKISSGSGSVFAEGRAVALVGSPNDCGHSMVSGSGDVNTT
jgi:uncharacterized Zn-binding protein involved in type VI secretion